MYLKLEKEGMTLKCECIQMGSDYTVCLYGGERPHVGSVVLAIPRESLTGQGMSTTMSVLNCIGHKDEVLAKLYAHQVALATNGTVVCTCGIHIDQASPSDIKRIEAMSKELLEVLLKKIHQKNNI